MVSDGSWTQEEQDRLEGGLLKCVSIINTSDKWKAIAREVGTRSARECAERFQTCRTMASPATVGPSPDVSDVDEEATPPETPNVDEQADNAPAGSTWWSKDRSWSRWHDWSGKRWDANRSWGAEWQESPWQDSANTWLEGDDAPAEEEPLDENQRRALEMRKEIEANRARMRSREEQHKQEENRRQEKKNVEIEEKRQKQREHAEQADREYREALAKKQALAEQRKQQQLQAKREAERTDIPFFGSHRSPCGPQAKGGGPQAKGGWAAKAGASKAQLQRQRKQELLDKQTAEVLANITNKTTECDEGGSGSDGSDEQPPTPAMSSAAPATTTAIAPPPSPPPTVGSRVNGSDGAAPKSKAASKKQKKKWWHHIDDSVVCPISLAPICELPSAPFQLEAEGSSATHYYDARFLANFLVSACDFIDPANRRPLTHEECKALDHHLLRHHPEDPAAAVSVADAFALFEVNGRSGPAAGDDRVQREATAVLQHLFRFSSARRTDRSGRAIAFADSGLTVVDDDDILTGAPDASSRSRQVPDDMDGCDYPDLAGNSTNASSQTTSSAWRGKAGTSSGYPSVQDAFPTLPPKPTPSKAAESSKGKAKPATKAASSKVSGVGRGGGRAKQNSVKVAKSWGAPA